MSSVLLRKRIVTTSLGAVTFLLILTLSYKSGNLKSVRRIKFDAENAADVTNATIKPSPDFNSHYLEDKSVVYKRKHVGKHSGEFADRNPCIMKRQAAIRRVWKCGFKFRLGFYCTHDFSKGIFSSCNEFFKVFKIVLFSATAWVLVPGGNGAAFVSTTIESIHRQEVPVRALYNSVLKQT